MSVTRLSIRSYVRVMLATFVAVGALGGSSMPAQAASLSAFAQAKKDPKSGAKKDPKAAKGRTSIRRTPSKGTGTPGAATPKPVLDPKLRERLGKLAESENARLAQEGKQSRTRRATPTTKPGKPAGRDFKAAAARAARDRSLRPKVEQKPDPTTQLAIPPVDSDIPPEARMYRFGIKDGTYEQLVEGFARQTGLGVIGSAPKDGKVSFVSSEELTFDEALRRVRMLLFKYKPHEPYWFDRKGTHLEVVRFTDKYRDIEFHRMFPSFELFEAANLPDDEIALVIHTPKTGSVADLRVVRDFMPDYVRVTPINNSSVSIFARVGDIRKYFQLIPVFGKQGDDPRAFETIEIHHILPSQAVKQIGELIDLSGGGKTRPTSTRRGKDVSPLDTLNQPEVSLLPLDPQGVLIVRAMQDKIEEIKDVLPYIDIDPASQDALPVVIPIIHAAPVPLINFLQQILAPGNQPAIAAPAASAAARRRKATQAAATPLRTPGATLLMHPSQSAVIVMAETEEDLQHVRDLIAKFDVPDPSEDAIYLPLEHASAVDVASTLTVVLSGGRPASDDFRVSPSEADDALWYSGDVRTLARVRKMLETLDAPGPDLSLHIVTLHRQQPTFVAGILREYDKSGAASPAAGKKRAGGGRRQTAANVSKFTPNDDQGRLFVVCSAGEWELYAKIIAQLDDAGREQPPFVRLDVTNISPQQAADRLGAMTVSAPHKTAVKFVPSDGAVLVMGAGNVRLEEIKTILAEIDRPVVIEQRSFVIVHRDPAEIRAAVEALVNEEGGATPSRRSSRPDPKAAMLHVTATPTLTILELGRKLVVRATPAKMEKVAALIAEFDVEDRETEVKVYSDFAPGTDIAALADTLVSLMSTTPSAGRPKKGAGPRQGAGTPRFIPRANARDLVVIAPPTMFAEVEKLLDVLRTTTNLEELVVEFVDVQHVDPEELVESITPLLDLKVRRLVLSGQLRDHDAAVPAGVPTTRRKPQAGEAGDHYLLDADSRNHRLVIAAPPVVVDEVRRLVVLFDRSSPEDSVLRSVRLVNAEPSAMVKAIREMMATPRRTPTRRPSTKPGSEPSATDGILTVFQAPGGESIMLHGPAKDVERAVSWIERLDEVSTSGRAIKVYEIQHADIRQLVEVILNVVDPTSSLGQPKPRGRKLADSLEEVDPWEPTKTWIGHSLFIRADFMAGTMLVAADESKMARIDEIVKQFNTEGTQMRPPSPLPSFIYELQFAEDAIDAAFEMGMLLESLWQPRDELPQVDALMFGNFLVVRYPHEDRFDELKELIRVHIDRADPKTSKIVKKSFQPPPGMSADQVAFWIIMNHPELEISLEDISGKVKPRSYVEELGPYRPPTGNPCALPLGLTRAADELLAAVLGQAASDGSGVEDSPTDAEPAAVGGAKRKLRIGYDSEKGVFVVEGPAGIVEEVDEWMEELAEEIEKFPVPPDIRIYRVRYIDVYTAAEILEEMFNATRQQRAQVAQQQRQAQQRLRQQQQLQRRQQQQAQAGKGQAGKGQPPAKGQAAQPQPQAAAQLPPTTVRIFPNPRDRTLILRADGNQYPALLELLATIDRPQPIENGFRILKLEKLNAGDVEELLKEMLSLDVKPPSAAKSTSTRRGAGQSTSRRQMLGRLPKTLMETMTSGVGALGVDPQDIKLSSNEAANTIIVMAPKVALDFVEELVKQLESEDIPERLTRYYELKHAAAEEVAEYLTAHFAQTGRPASLGKRESGGSSSALDLNTPSFVPYSRLNLLTALATSEQLEEIDGIIARVDVSGDEDRWRDVSLAHVNAKVVADALTKMFGQPMQGLAAAGKGTAGRAPQFFGDDGGRILFFSAADSLHERILATIATFEAEAKDDTTVRVIQLQHELPTKIAEAIEAAYATKSGSGGAAAARFSVSGHDPTKRLFIKTDDVLFAELESLVRSLDKPRQFDFQFRIFPLQYADARQVHTHMTALLTDYLRRLGPKGGDVPPFSVEVDDRANALVVLGSPVVFGFLEDMLAKIDTPAAAMGKPGFLIVALKNANAQEVAGNIARLWDQRGLPPGETPPHAEANQALNVLIVRGTGAQLEEIKRSIVEPLEAQGPAEIQKSIKLTHVDPGTVQDAIGQLFGAGTVGPRDRIVSVPDFGSNSIIVSGSPESLRRVEELVAQLDTEDGDQRDVHVINLHNVDADAVTQTLTEIFIRSAPQRKGGQAPVSIAALRGSKALLVKCRSDLFAEIKTVVDDLDRSDTMIGEAVRVVQLLYGDATEMHGAMEKYLGKPGGRAGELAGDVRISVLSQSNSLVVSGSREEVDRLETTIRQLDVAGEKGSVPEIIHLEHIRAGEIVASLQEMFSQRGGARGKTPPVIIADEARNNLLVRAGAADLTAIQTMVERLDIEDQLPENFRIVKVAEGINVTDLAETIAGSVNESARARPGKGREAATLTVTPNPRTNSLILAGSPSLFDDAEKMVRALEEMGPSGGKGIRIITLGRVPGEDIERLIEQLRGEGRGSSRSGRSGSSNRPRRPSGRRGG